MTNIIDAATLLDALSAPASQSPEPAKAAAQAGEALPFGDWRLATPSRVAEPADHIPVTPEEAKLVDDALGIVELPPIRVDWATHAELVEAAKARGLVIQAVVRERLAAVPASAQEGT